MKIRILSLLLTMAAVTGCTVLRIEQTDESPNERTIKTTVKATGGAQFYGAMTANSFSSSGNFFFHHDQAAGKTIPSKPLAIQGWRELTTPGS